RTSGQPRVAVVTNMWPHPGRAAFGIFVQEQVRGLREIEGLDVAVFPLEPIEHRSRYLSGGRISRQIAEGGFDVVHVHHPFSLLALAPNRRRLSHIPIVLTIHGIEGTDGWRRRVTSAVIGMADEIVVTNRVLLERYGGHPVPCGVDPGRFHPGPPRGAGTAEVITVGEDRPEKQFWLARAAVAWARTVPAPPFSHRFVSAVPPADMPAMYRSATVLLLSSKAEGSPMVVEEALASGLRVVATNVGDLGRRGGPPYGLYVAGEQTAPSLGRALVRALQDDRAMRPFEPDFHRLDHAVARLAGLYRAVTGMVQPSLTDREMAP
ncbi:MAG TPA: glycosyltransferase family 4 protein, partial [Actinomycetota bacterium]